MRPLSIGTLHTTAVDGQQRDIEHSKSPPLPRQAVSNPAVNLGHVMKTLTGTWFSQHYLLM